MAATGVRSSSTRWACRHLRDCSASTPTCLAPFQLTSTRLSRPGDPPPSGLSAEERRAYDQLVRTFKQVDYARLMGSRPQTLYGIADSHVGLAAWLRDHNGADGQAGAAG